MTFAPTDLTGYLECLHLARLELQVKRGERTRPVVENLQAELIRRKGMEHEEAYLAQLLAEGRDVVREPDDAEAALRAGADVIYQARFVDGAWRGIADFVVRQADGSYEAVDTKLARHGKPAHVLQLCFYSEQIGRITGRMPQRMHIALGSGETESYRVNDFLAYYRRVRARYEAFAADAPHTEPYPVPHCRICDFIELCTQWWEEHDHLSRVARMRHDQVVRLSDAGITTLAKLGAQPRGTEIPRMAATTFEALRHQAELQLRARETGRHEYALLAAEEKCGFQLLPKPSEGDLFFDMEGDPWWEPSRGLEYLFGVMERSGEFHAFWAHTREEEKRAFEQFVDFVHERLERDSNMHVYHYASYEPTALKLLMSEYATREDEVDDLLRKEVFVDLYAVVRQSLRISYPSYSIKNVERFYMQREAELRAGDDSILLYERWVDERDDSILQAIKEYNREDCLSTLRLLDWLLDLRPDGIPWREPPPPREIKEEAVHVDVRDELLALLLDYHRREAKPIWWQFFRRLDMTNQELIDDADSIGGLELVAADDRDFTFRFPSQEHKLDPGDQVIDPFTEKSAGRLVDIGDETLLLRRDPEKPLPQALVPLDIFDTRVQREALVRFAQQIDRYTANESVLHRVKPLDGARVQRTTLGEYKQLVDDIEGRHLFVQGPPGSGKTYTGARLIVHLLKRGKRVGVASNTHKAIHNLLREVEKAAREDEVTFKGVKKSSSGNRESRYDGTFITSANDVVPDDEVQLYAGTAWLHARPEFDQRLDYLFIDEAGQVSLADALAMGTSARTLVLLGDPLQLAQVRQGIHPRGSGASVLEHLLGDAQTIPEDRGLFLERSFRMHPEVCCYISDAFYESRLEPAEGCERQSTAAGVGLRFVPVEHEGNRQFAPEEAEAIAEEIARIGVLRNEIIVVAPYNMQVRCLKERLPAGVRVGTVDKFQGQEAPVVFFSMATSSGEDVPRNLEFLLSRNRLNVAISRARCLAYVVASPKLLEVGCRSIEQMRMANALCLFAEDAMHVPERP